MSDKRVLLSGESDERCVPVSGVLLSFAEWAGVGLPVRECAAAACAAYQSYCSAFSALYGSAGRGRSVGDGCDCAAIVVGEDSGECGSDKGFVGASAVGCGFVGCRRVVGSVAASASPVAVGGSSVAVDGGSGATGNVCGVSGGESGRSSVGVSRSFVDGDRCAPRVGVGCLPGLPRGPNFQRNHAARLRKRELALARKSDFLQRMETMVGKVESVGSSVVQGSAAVRQCAGAEQELRELRLERQIIQERRKLDKLKSPTQMIEDAMRQVAMAERCAKLANDSKVAAWAADLSSASAESIARSAGADVRTLKSGGSVTSAVRGVTGSFAGKLFGVASMSRGSGVVAEEPVALSECAVVEDSVDSSGDVGVVRTVDSLTRDEALKWLKSRAYLDKFYFSGKGLAAICRASGAPVSEVNKYLVLRKRYC